MHWGWFLSGTEMVHSVVTCSWGLELRQAWPRPVFSITRICWLMDAIIIHTMPLIITHTTASDACICCDIVHVIVVLTGLCCQDLCCYVNMNSVSPLSQLCWSSRAHCCPSGGTREENPIAPQFYMWGSLALVSWARIFFLREVWLEVIGGNESGDFSQLSVSQWNTIVFNKWKVTWFLSNYCAHYG